MTQASTARERSLIEVVVLEPLALVKAQPHQFLLSTGSVAIMAQFAAHGGIVHPTVGYLIAVGVEWAYLRGLASDARARSWWGDALNWSAFGIVVLWGVLWVSTVYGAISDRPVGAAGVVLAAAHIVPIAWLSLCAAMCHRGALAADETEARRLEEERRAIEREAQAARVALELEMEKKRFDLEMWEQAERARVTLKQLATPVVTPVTPASQPVTAPSRDDQRALVVTAIVTHGAALNVSQWARENGISRAMFYKLRDEAMRLGELPKGGEA